ncbi:unnamed protein product, partial [Scytosiphon promiscuus]
MFSRLFGGSAPDASSDVKGATAKEGGGSNEPKVEKDEVLASHISKMDSLIRRKLHGTGAQYNMKVVIRGERGVGKSTLWRRLQGLPYEEKYNPTPEIQTTTINNWVYRGSQDVVKVEVWDVVDKGLARGGVSRVPEGEDLEDAVAGLPPDSGSGRGGRSLAVLDAGVVNVYQGASAIIFMVDPYRPETLDKVEESLAEAPFELPTVVLLNFRDKLEEDAVAKASEKPGNPSPAPTRPPKQQPAPAPASTAAPGEAASAKTPPPSDTGGDVPAAAAAAAAAAEEEGDVSGAGATGVSGGGDRPGVVDRATVEGDGGGDGGGNRGAGGGTGGAWDHVVTLETARLMMDRVREADEAAGRGARRRVSLFDCSMKNCFGLRVLYTYLNVPFLELKRKALLQQAEIASERLEKEYQELAGFIGGHSYGNYMQHLRSSDVDPTAGARTVPAAPPGRPSIASMPATSELPSSLERRGSVDSHGGGVGGRKDKKKKHHKDKDKEKSKKKDKHRHKSGKTRKDDKEEAAPEYGGRVTDAKDFTPATKKTATDELADFFGESSEEGSDEGLRERRKVVKAINPSALANAAATAVQDDATDSDEMPAPRTSRLKRVTAPSTSLKKPESQANASMAARGIGAESDPRRPSDTKRLRPRRQSARGTRECRSRGLLELAMAWSVLRDSGSGGAAGAGSVSAAVRDERTAPQTSEAPRAESGVVDGGERLSQAGATGDGESTGKGAAFRESGETGDDADARRETEDSPGAGRGSDNGAADDDDGRLGVEDGKRAGGGQEREAVSVGGEEGKGGAEETREQVREATPAVSASSPPVHQPSPTDSKDPPPETDASRGSPETAVPDEHRTDAVAGAAGGAKRDDDDSSDLEVDEDVGTGTDGDTCISDAHQRAGPAAKESEPSAEVGAGVGATPDAEGAAVEKRGGEAAEEEGEGSGAREFALARTEEAEPESRSQAVDEEIGVEVGGERGERGSGDGVGSVEGGDGGAEGGVGADNGSNAAVAAGDLGDEPGTAARELGARDGDPLAEEGGASGAGVAEDFFAGDNSSSEENEIFSAAAAGPDALAAPAGETADSDDATPPLEQPPSPRIIASSLRRGNDGGSAFARSPVGAQRKSAAAAEGGGAASGNEG